jgi:hypothetical protein
LGADLGVALSLVEPTLDAGLGLGFATGFLDELREAEAPFEPLEGDLALVDVFRA